MFASRGRTTHETYLLPIHKKREFLSNHSSKALFTWRTVDRIRSASHWSTGERAPFTTATAPRGLSRRPMRGRPYQPDPVNRTPCEPSLKLCSHGVRLTGSGRALIGRREIVPPSPPRPHPVCSPVDQ
ncbi:unnamed protein product [Nesidiocoris tenuis]|uniref:Uncharacterized protein n=1 Tax=Nesidiocoris tenuis TaxID=355587 RepID=A0A6H5HKL3_9HEMI|nr:unnamed protein product [Nesidiocoris tenuis]